MFNALAATEMSITNDDTPGNFRGSELVCGSCGELELRGSHEGSPMACGAHLKILHLSKALNVYDWKGRYGM